MHSQKPKRLIPCDFGPPRRCPVEGPNGWYTREWMPGEREHYQQSVLMKPNEDRLAKL